MNFGQMREAFAAYTGIIDEVDAVELAFWFNEAQLDLAWELAPVQKASLDEAQSAGFIPPTDWLTIIGADKLYRVTPEGRVVFEQPGASELFYRQMPQAFSGVDEAEASELHPVLHYLLPVFAAARYWDKEAEGDSEESRQASKWLSYYYQGKNLAKSRLFGINEPIEAWQVRG